MSMGSCITAARGRLLLGAGALAALCACGDSDPVKPGPAGPPTLAFMSRRDGENPDIYTIRVDGTNLRRLTTDAAYDGFPEFSPDGSKIAFESDRARTDPDAIVDDVYVMNADGTGVQRLTNDPVLAFGPSWSPDGSKIIFSSVRDDPIDLLDVQLYVMNADGTNQTRLTTDPGQRGAAHYSPDGTKLVFPVTDDVGSTIWVMNANGTGAVRLSASASAIDYDPRWSPDGSEIIYSSNNEDPNGDIYVMNADGTNVRRLTTEAGADYGPAISPDGLKIAFTSERRPESSGDLWVMNADGSDPVMVSAGNVDQFPVWQP